MVNSPPFKASVQRDVFSNVDDVDRKKRTASTRSSDVLPAFCNPIMVMSISVALSVVTKMLDSHIFTYRTHSSPTCAGSYVMLAHGEPMPNLQWGTMKQTYQKRRKSQS